MTVVDFKNALAVSVQLGQSAGFQTPLADAFVFPATRQSRELCHEDVTAHVHLLLSPWRLGRTRRTLCGELRQRRHGSKS